MKDVISTERFTVIIVKKLINSQSILTLFYIGGFGIVVLHTV